MTAPAPRNHPAEGAHPAPTPAPVAVPEGIHRGIEPDTEMGGVICSECGWHLAGRDTMQAGEMDERQRQHDEHHAPRPEPVVASLPSEADLVDLIRQHDSHPPHYAPLPSEESETPLQALASSVLHDYEHGRWITHADLATKVRALADWVLRLVPEDYADATDPLAADDRAEIRRYLTAREPGGVAHIWPHQLEALLAATEDDEDTVRVPREALIELNAAVMDRKRDLVDAIEEFNDEVRS